MYRPLPALLLAALVFATLAGAQDIIIERTGTAEVDLRGTCQPGLATTTSLAIGSLSMAVPQGDETLPPPDRKCLKKLGKFCRKICRRNAMLAICQECGKEAACQIKPSLPPRNDIEVKDTVTLVFRYAFLTGSHPNNRGCQLQLLTADGEVFFGACDGPPKGPALDEERNNFLLPFGVTDVSANNWANTPSTFGSFRGYIVGSLRLLEQPQNATPEDIRGITGILTYSLGSVWLPPVQWFAPWKLGPYPASGNVCVYSGRLRFGDVPDY